METTFIVFNLIFLLSSLSVSYLFKSYYPQDINSLIGYRTKRSMRSKESWILANKYASGLLFRYSLITASIQVILFIVFDGKVAILGAASTWIVLLLITLLQTETMLKKEQTAPPTFDSNILL